MFGYIANIIEKSDYANIIHLYFSSLGAIFFQYNDLAGFILAIGLLLVSRISFVSSIIGFVFGYLFYRYFEGDFSQLVYSYIGFNFILTSIAINGFFLVANKKSILLLIVIVPIIAILISSLSAIFIIFSLPIYSLPFCLIVILLLSALSYRIDNRGIYPVLNQTYSHEKNHYQFYNNIERFKATTYIDISLPFIGSWFVSQGHDGNITHVEGWKHAWDFDVRDEDKKTFQREGLSLKDYYCYDLPVLAPASGWVVDVVNDVKDNNIGEVNTIQNWGNTIVIKHSEYLYSSLSHLRKDSVNLKIGDYVNKGDIIAKCGSSGRSPEPHLHFQLQATPKIGSQTIKYPISCYVENENNNNNNNVCFYDIPKENHIISQVEKNKYLANAFSFTPGKKIRLIYVEKLIDKELIWEIRTNIYNQSYVYCEKTNSYAYFVNNGVVFYFTYFEGNKKSLLYDFYLSAQKVLLAHYHKIKIDESVLTEGNFSKLIHTIHDITAPLFHYIKTEYSLNYEKELDYINLSSHIKSKIFGKEVFVKKFEIKINENGIYEFFVNLRNKKINAKCEIL